MKMKFLLLICVLIFSVSSFGSNPFNDIDRERVVDLMMSHHSGKYFVWWECGHGLTKAEGEIRAGEYADSIIASIKDVYMKTNEFIDPRHVRAIIYKESSDNECIVGLQESEILKKQLGKNPDKKEIIDHVKKWWRSYRESISWCKHQKEHRTCNEVCSLDNVSTRGSVKCLKSCRGYIGRSGCVYVRMNTKYPEYGGIHAWDLGAGQFRYPALISKRQVTIPDGKTVKISIDTLLDYRVSIQLLVESLASYKKACRDHVHYVKDRRYKGGRRKLDTEQAYYAHHNTGTDYWSEHYWRRIRGSIEKADRWSRPVLAIKRFLFFKNLSM